MQHELRKRGFRVYPQAKIDVIYDGVHVGEYFADLLVEDCVILELKAAEQLASEHEAQLLNYLKGSSIDVGLLFNFGPKPQFRRKVFETARLRPFVSPPPYLLTLSLSFSDPRFFRAGIRVIRVPSLA
jgi:GxxExxY protein